MGADQRRRHSRWMSSAAVVVIGLVLAAYLGKQGSIWWLLVGMVALISSVVITVRSSLSVRGASSWLVVAWGTVGLVVGIGFGIHNQARNHKSPHSWCPSTGMKSGSQRPQNTSCSISDLVNAPSQTLGGTSLMGAHPM